MTSNTLVKIPFGKYKGSSLQFIKEIDPSYLQWLISADTIPEQWKILAKDILENSSHVPTPISINPSFKIELSIFDNETLQVKFPFDREFLDRFKLIIDGRKWNSDEKCWTIPNVQILKLVEFLGGTQHIIAPDAVKEIYKAEKERRTHLDEIRVLEDSNINIGTLIDLRPFQKVAVEFGERAGGRFMIADSMGLGKTATSIGYATRNTLKTLIVCPKSVVPHWVREIKRFSGKNSAIWTSDGRGGRSDLKFHVINYDIVAKFIPELRKMKFNLLVCDEATYLKNRQTKRAKSVLGSYKERRKYPGIQTDHVIFLTGTPVLNRPIEAFHLLNFLDKGRFNNFYQFTTRYGGWKGEPPKNLDELHSRTKDLIIRRLKKDVSPELPDKQRMDILIEMDKTDMKEYQIHLDKLFRKWRALGKPTIAEMPAIQNFLFEKKLPRLIEIIDELLENNKGVLIYSVYIDPLKQLLEHYKDDAALVYGQMNSEERQESIDALSEGRKKIGLMSMGAGAMGIDGLQKSIDTVIFVSHWWVPAVHEQAEDRLCRMGQTEKVQVFYMICENTIDEYMREILTDKQKVIDTIVDGRLVSIARDKSFFKEFVRKISSIYLNKMNEIDLENTDDETVEIVDEN